MIDNNANIDQGRFFSNYSLPNYGLSSQSVMGTTDPSVMPAIAPAAAVPAPSPTSMFPTQPTAQAPGLGSLTGYAPTPGVNPAPNASGLGMNVGTMGLALGGLNTIGSLWNAWEANKLAKEQFAFSKDFANSNLKNSMEAYNTTLQNHTDARASYEGWSNQEANAYVREHRLSKK